MITAWKRTLAAMILSFSCIQAMAFGKEEARALVGKFYNCLKVIAEEKYTLENSTTVNSNNAYNEAGGLCYDLSINMPNDFHAFNYSGDTNESFLEAAAYMRRLQFFAIEKKNVRYSASNVREVRALEEIKHRNSENSTNFYAVFVDKTISAGNQSKNYVDTVLVNVESYSGGKIIKVTNNVSGVGGGESIMQMRAKAAELFADGRYQEAYDVYLKIVSKDPSQGDPFYRLALMGFQNKGCKNRYKNRSARIKQAFKFLEEAKKNGTTEIKRNAQNVEYDMTNGFI
ncbi:MAG: hypothetical protein IJ551_11505 [Prevotella sp.]|nr:hypothetical protein [Prevotella sp.]MBQ8713425.1 hypothetical protein [Prevotella sp.]